MHRVLQFTTPLRTASLGATRDRLLREVTDLAGIKLDDDRKYALRVCASEAVANGIKHGFGGQAADGSAALLIEADIDKDRERLRITVTDGGMVVPSMNGRMDDPEATCGRGLGVIAGYADDVGWGQRTNSAGSVMGWSVWFELEVQTSSAADQATAHSQTRPDRRDDLGPGGSIRSRIAVLTAAVAVRRSRPQIRIGTLGAPQRQRVERGRTAA
ncbi:ATP-binding protein [Kitasatospora sp. NPDC092286]|uniref:ATP-binding protein n=1 Tax=Kitasatospora sp. NPDC092286 TaxID=3364087 RepID=UPI0038125CE5